MWCGYDRTTRRREVLSTAARILATADKFDALSADRPYRPGMPLERVLKMLHEDAGRDLCPDCLEAVCHVADRWSGSQAAGIYT